MFASYMRHSVTEYVEEDGARIVASMLARDADKETVASTEAAKSKSGRKTSK